MLEFLKKESSVTYTENGALAYSTTGKDCLDLFFRAGAMRDADEKDISKLVIRAYAEDPVKTMKILFYVRDVRQGLGERRFFRTAIKSLLRCYPDAVERNIPFFAEYGRYDDLLTVIGSKCEDKAIDEIKNQLNADIEAMQKNENVSLLAKWLPSVNASSTETKLLGKRMAKLLGMNEKKYRKTLSALRKYIDIIENHLRISNYTFDYSSQTSCSMFKYRKAFLRNDEERYKSYIDAVMEGKEKLNASVLYPYEISRACLASTDEKEIPALDATWKNLPDYADNDENAIAVIDTSGSMMWGASSVRPLDVSLSLGIYFAEHNKGMFANHFITFSGNPRLIELKGNNIYEKIKYCLEFTEYTNTNLEGVFNLLLNTAVKNNVPAKDMPSKIYIISDMEFDSCIYGGNSMTLFNAMQKKYQKNGYKLPDIVFWNVASRNDNIPVNMSDTGATLVSGFSPILFEMTMCGEISPVAIMEKVISSERYAQIK